MSYAVVHMQKIKSHALKGMQFHHQRERESRTNFDIDKTHSNENYDLVNEQPIDFNKRVNEIIESQKTGSRKTRKDAVLVNELLVTSDSPFFEKLSEAEQRKFFEESLKIFEERYGKQNIAYAMVHVDEKTPHMHVGIVPMREGKLQGKNVFNRAELIWLQDHFADEVNKHGFDLERGEKGSNRQHIEMQIFKKMTMEQELKELESQLLEKQDRITEKKEELLAFSERLPLPNDAKINVLGREVQKTVIKKVFGGEEVVKKPTDNYVIALEEIHKKNDVINAAIRVNSEFKRLLTTDLVTQNHSLFNQIDELKMANKQLLKENDTLKVENRSLRFEIKNLYEILTGFLKERTNDFGVFQTHLRAFVDKVKEKVPQSLLGGLHDKENAFNVENLNRMNKQINESQSVKKKSRGMER